MKIIRMGGRECFNDLPMEVNWLLTFNCNYRCSYCFAYGKGKNPPPPRQFSTLEQLRTAVNNIASLNRPYYRITLGGGEPTIHPHIFELLSMLHETLRERLNSILIITNGSRNKSLYDRLAKLAKSINIKLLISIHTDHVDMSHILELIENLSGYIDLDFSIMFNPDKREMVHEIYDIMLNCRKKFYFHMNVVMLLKDDCVDPRYTKEDFEWQKKSNDQFNKLVGTIQSQFPPRKIRGHSIQVIRDIEENGNEKIVSAGNRHEELTTGLLNLKDLYCVTYAFILNIDDNGAYRGMVCDADPWKGNIYEKNCFRDAQDNLIHAIKCPMNVCGCGANDPIPKFASAEDAKKYVEFAKKRQAELFAEYEAAQSQLTLIDLLKAELLAEYEATQAQLSK